MPALTRRALSLQVRYASAVAAVIAAASWGPAQEVASFKAPFSVHSLGWTADGKALVAAGKYADKVKLLDPATGKELASYAPSKGSISCAAVSADGRYLAAATTDFGGAKVAVWDLTDGKAIAEFTSKIEHQVAAIALSPDGKWVAVAGGTVKGGSKIEVWSPGQPAAEAKTLTGHPTIINALAFSPDGKQLASGGFDKVTRLWNLATGDGQVVGPEQPAHVRQVTFSPDGKWLVSVSTFSSTAKAEPIAFYNLKTKALDTVLRGELRATNHLSFSPNGKLAVTAHVGQFVRVWDVTTGKELVTYKGLSSPTVASFSPDGRTVAAGAQEDVIKVWPGDPKGVAALTAPDPTKLMGHTSAVRAVAYAPDGKFLASCSDDLTVKLWDPANGKELRTITVLRQPTAKAPAPKTPVPKKVNPKTPVPAEPIYIFDAVVSLDISPNGKQLAVTAGHDVKLYNTADGNLEGTLKVHTSNVTAVRYAAAGNTLATADNGEVVLWNPTTRKLAHRLPHTSPPTFAFTPDGTKLFSGGAAIFTPGGMRQTEVATGKGLGFTLNGQTAFLTRGVSDGFPLDFSPNGKTVLMGSRLHDWATANVLWELTNGGNREGELIRFSPHGRHLAGGANNKVVIWDAATGKEVTAIDFQGIRSSVSSRLKSINVAWSPDGKTLAVTGPGQSAEDATKTPVLGGNTKPPINWSVRLVDVTQWVK